jgi:hypothetical protein
MRATSWSTLAASAPQPVLNARQRALTAIGQSRVLRAPRKAAARSLTATWVTPWPVLAKRADLPLLLNRRGLLGCGVEVGVKEGVFSETLLAAWNGRHLISVDPWKAASEEQYINLDNVSQEVHDRFYAEAVRRLNRFGERCTIWRMTGREAALRIPHHSLDFVYLDARHDYASVRRDLEEWFPRVRPTGIIAGHDYIDGTFVNGEFGVRSAVDDFFAARSLRVRVTFTDSPWISWFVIAPAA